MIFSQTDQYQRFRICSFGKGVVNMKTTEKLAGEMTLSRRKEELKKLTAEFERKYAPQTGLQSQRALYHLMPPVGWLNDPNGLCYYKGRYHVFFQYSPFTPKGGMKMWGHYSSPDMVHYHYEGAAIVPDEAFDKDGVYSGSAVSREGKLYVFYTGNVKEEGNHDYILSGRGANVIRMESEDGIHFQKKICILTNEDYPEECTCHVRDPKLYIGEDGAYRMVLGARLRNEKGAVLLYRSEDLLHFAFEEMYTTQEAFGYMWECPDIFEIDGYRILSVCPQGVESQEERYQNIYQSGYYVQGSDEFTEWDMGFDFYAPQTFEAPDGRRILIGWAGVPDAGYNSNPMEEDWQHCLTVPRELTWHNGKIYQYPVQELTKLRGGEWMPDETGRVTMPGKCGEVLAENIRTKQGAVYMGSGCVLKWDKGHVTLSFQDETGAGRTIRNAHVSQVESLRILVDVSILEIYVNHGEIVMTSRFFMKQPDVEVCFKGKADRLEFYCIGGRICETFGSDWRGTD